MVGREPGPAAAAGAARGPSDGVHGTCASTAASDRGAPPPGLLVPVLYRVVGTRPESPGVATLALEPTGARAVPDPEPGQFNMVTAFGVGEIALSASGVPGGGLPLEHTVRDVGAVSHALATAAVGTVVGVRGPFGTGWGVDGLADGTHVVAVGGGIGLAPLRGAVAALVGRPGVRVTVLVGARSPEHLVFVDDLRRWEAAGATVAVTVDTAGPGWRGSVGVVTSLVERADLDPARTVALVCGPEVMMRYVGRALEERGVDPRRVLVSLERNMHCGVGLCGHCQLGSFLLCRDGPVVAWGGLADGLLTVRER